MEWTAGSAEGLARRLMSDTPRRWRHVEGVAARAVALGASEPCLMAAWLHDIGYSEVLQDTGMHAIDGARYLSASGAPSEVVSLVAFHTGAEFEAEERELSRDLEVFPSPGLADLDLLTLADLTTGPDGRYVDVADRLDEVLRRYAGEHPVHRAVARSRAVLEVRCARARQLV